MFGYIYETTNLINGKKYIGQKTSKIFLKEKYLGSGTYLKRALNKYGKENFKVRLIEECDSKEELDSQEIYWIDYYNAVKSKDYYNQSSGGEHWDLPSEYIAETNRKYQSKKMKGRIYISRNYDEEKLIWSYELDEYTNCGWTRGRSKKSKLVISQKTKEALKDVVFTEEQRYKMGSPNRGKHLSEETKTKMSNYWKNRPKPWSRQLKSEETKAKMSISARNRKRDAKGRFIKEVL
jgi:hypothetical protein